MYAPPMISISTSMRRPSCGKADAKVRTDADFVLYNNKNAGDGAVIHQSDNRTGEGAGDDEQIEITLSKMPADVDKVAVVVTIHNNDQNGQTFGQVSNAFIRLVDAANNNCSSSDYLRHLAS